MEIQETPKGQYPWSAKLLSKSCHCYLNAFKALEQHFDNLFECKFGVLGHFFAHWINWNSYVLHDLAQLSFPGWHSFQKGSNPLKVYSERAKKHTWYYAENEPCYRCFSRNWFSRNRYFNRLFLMYAKQNLMEYSSVVSFNPLMLVVTKERTDLDKPGSLRWRFA